MRPSFLIPVLFFLTSTAAFADARPADIVDVRGVEPSIAVDMMYFGVMNFVGRPIRGYRANVCLLTKAAATAIAGAQRRLRAIGLRRNQDLVLLVRDCYRPKKSVAHFLEWVARPDQLEMKEFFYPNLTKQQIVDDGYLAPVSGHSRASTVDLTIGRRGEDGKIVTVPMGTRVDFFGVEAHTDYPGITAEEKANRRLLKSVLGSEFRNFSGEWWHYALLKEPYPRTYFDFDVE